MADSDSGTQLKVLSLGAGVQSSTVLLMSCRGVLHKLDAAIFADTQWEPKAVYEWLTFLESEAVKAGIPIFRVTKGNIRKDALRSRVRSAEYKQMEDGRWASMPLYTMLNDRDSEGQIRRQCTKEYKITPITQKARELKEQSGAYSVQQWYGISADEMRRMRFSQVGWIENYYPLIFGLERPYHRHDCLRWLEENGFSQAPRSACLGCPYHSDAEWRAIKENPQEWADVVAFDASIRKVGGQTADTYLHRSCKPLPMIDLSTAEERGQLNWLQECEGMCGV